MIGDGPLARWLLERSSAHRELERSAASAELDRRFLAEVNAAQAGTIEAQNQRMRQARVAAAQFIRAHDLALSAGVPADQIDRGRAALMAALSIDEDQVR